jgi:hypothetical protein
MNRRRLLKVAVRARGDFLDPALQRAAAAVMLKCRPRAWRALGYIGRESLEEWFMEALTDAVTEEICEKMDHHEEEPRA